jgi:hypothetical protein
MRKPIVLLICLVLLSLSLYGCYTKSQLEEAYQQGYKDALTVSTADTPEPTKTPKLDFRYAQGAAAASMFTPAPAQVSKSEHDYVLNTNSHKFHYPDCPSVDQMKDSNKKYFTGTREEVIEMGYDPCGNCDP